MNVDAVPESEACRELRMLIEARGEARGEARMLLQVFAVRGMAVDDAFRERVMQCDDRSLLERWHARAITAQTLDDVINER